MKKLFNTKTGIAKVTFGIWVEWFYGVSYEYYDNNFGDQQIREANELYDEYWDSEDDDYDIIVEEVLNARGDEE